ncbi:MAG: hypothetical protein OHK0046_10230 [Anaerolineae bacterium]
MRRINLVVILLLLFPAVITRAQSDAFDCPGTLAPRLNIGGQGIVTPGSANNVRSDPATSGQLVFRLEAGSVFQVLDGPICSDGFVWWQVRFNGSDGWTVEGDGSSYFLEPVSAADISTPTATTPAASEECTLEPRLEIGREGRIVSTTPSRLRDAPSTSGTQIGQIQPDDVFVVFDGPVCADDIYWWDVDVKGISGWTAEGVDGDYLVELLPLLPTRTPADVPPVALALDWVEDVLVVGTENGLFVFDTANLDSAPVGGAPAGGAPSQLFAGSMIENVAINPLDPTQIALTIGETDTNTIVFYDLAEGEEVLTVPETVPTTNTNTFGFLADGRLAYNRFGYLHIFDPESGEIIYQTDGPDEAFLVAAALSPDGEQVAGFFINNPGAAGPRANVIVGEVDIDISDFTVIDELENEPIPNTLTQVSFAADGSRFIIGDSSGSLRQWTVPDLDYSSFIRSAEQRSTTSNRINAVIYHPTENLVITAEGDPRAVIRAFDVDTLTQIFAYTGGETTFAANDLDFNDDATLLAVAVDNRVLILENYELLMQLTLRPN